jgi:uncharacterized protein (TIGR02147 family)
MTNRSRTLPKFQDWVRDQLGKKFPDERGLQSRMAEFLGLDNAQMSRALQGTRSMSDDELVALSEFLELESQEEELLFLLSRWNQAKTTRLKVRLDQQIRKLLNALENPFPGSIEHSPTSNSLPVQSLESEALAYVYSGWLPLAILYSLDVSGRETVASLAAALRVELAQVEDCLARLRTLKLIEVQLSGGDAPLRYRNLSESFREKSPPGIQQYLTQWRLKAIESLPRKHTHRHHSSAVAVISRQDAEWMNERIRELKGEFFKRASQSTPEQVFCLNIDWFEV